MYLTKMRLNKQSADVRHAIADRQNFHAALQKMFNTDRKTSDVLYRINEDSVYISSNKMMNVNKVDGFEFIVGRELTAIDGTHAFSIITIPNTTINGKKTTLRTTEERIQWLRRQGERCGFKIVSVQEKGKDYIKSSKKNFAVTAFNYCGVLEITDPKLFEKVRLEGIGPMKAYGCGMLVVA